MKKIIDLSQDITDDMPVYPNDVKTSLFQSSYLSVNNHNNHRLEISMHTGTHIDSPMHMTDYKEYISNEPLELFVGEGCILDVRNESVISMKPEYESLVKKNSIVLLYTEWDKHYGTRKYYEEHPVLGLDLCAFLVENKVKLIGMDMPSPDRYPFEAHKYLFNNHIMLAENLTNINKLINIGEFEVIAMPLKIKADSSIARVAARQL